jgi:hypothetical protein
MYQFYDKSQHWTVVSLWKDKKLTLPAAISRVGITNFLLSFDSKKSQIMVKYTVQFLTKLEDMIAESDYTLRYEKGNFKSGFCVLKDQKIMIINKFFTTEGKINALLEILKGVTLDNTRFTEKSLKLYEELGQQQSEAA